MMLSLPFLFVGIFFSYVQAQYTLDDVAMHGTNSDCWSAAFGEVYDLTAYAPNHPNPSIYSMCGKDGTAVFESTHGDNLIYLDIFVDYLGTVDAAAPAPVFAPVPATPAPVVPVDPALVPVPVVPVQNPAPDVPVATYDESLSDSLSDSSED